MYHVHRRACDHVLFVAIEPQWKFSCFVHVSRPFALSEQKKRIMFSFPDEFFSLVFSSFFLGEYNSR